MIRVFTHFSSMVDYIKPLAILKIIKNVKKKIKYVFRTTMHEISRKLQRLEYVERIESRMPASSSLPSYLNFILNQLFNFNL